MRTIARCRLVDVLRNDQVDLAAFVLEQHEHDAVGGGGTLPRDRETRIGHVRAMRGAMEIVTPKRSVRKMRTQEQERVHADREAGEPVVGRHPLPARQITKSRSRRRRIERERELLGRALRPRDGGRSGGEAELPEKIATLWPEAVTRTSLDERHETVLRERDAPRQISDVPVGPVRDPLCHESRGVVLSHRLDVRETDTHRLGSIVLIQHTVSSVGVSEQRASLRFTSGDRTSTPRRCASRTRLAGG